MPKELDLNLKEMRERAVATMIDTLRLALQSLEDIDALERVLHSQAAEITTAVVRSSNGHGPPQRETRAERLLAAPKANKYSKKTSRAAVLAAAMPIVVAHPEGITTVDLAEQLRSTKIFSPTITRDSAASAIRAALLPAVQAKRLRSTKTLGRSGGLTFYPVAGTSPVPPRAATTRASDSAKIKPSRPALRTFIIEQLIGAGAAMSPRTLTQRAVEFGFEPRYRSDRLSNYMSRELRRLTAEHTLNKRRTGTGQHDIEYSIVRPNVKVTKR